METTRCPRCNKLLRADAQSCSRCGILLPTSKSTRKRASDAGQTLAPSQASNPPASPHRAGHYSGLHPEDQPFQSSFFMRIQRSAEPAEPLESDASTLLDVRDEQPSVESQRPLFWQEGKEDPATRFSPLADFPTLPPRRALNTPIPETPPAPRLRKAEGRGQGRAVRVFIAASVIFFLLATGLLTLLLLNQGRASSHEPQLQALPGELRVGDTLQLSGSGFSARHLLTLVRDTRTKLLDPRGRSLEPTTDAQGTFQLLVPITPAWSLGVHTLQASDQEHSATTTLTIQAAGAGSPRLQLGIARLDMGAGDPGSLTHKNMTLTNAGGGQVRWSAQSSVPWLTLSPASGAFVGNALVTLTVNRANLTPQAYLGQIVFSQVGGGSQTLYVSMTVNTTPASLTLSTASLAFAGTPAQSPAGQTIVLQNNGGQTLNWTGGSATSDGANWLSVTPASGQLAASTSVSLTVTVDTRNMALGSYQGTLSFSYAGGPVQQVAITLMVNPPPQPVMHISARSLSFATNQGFNPKPQSFTISNTGNGPLDWTIHTDANGTAYLAIAPASGSVPPGQSVNVSIAPLLGSAHGTINSTLTILDSDPGTNVPTQQVSVSIAITNQPVITLSTSRLEFDHTSTISDSSELLIFSDSGSLPLNWSISESAQVPWLSFDTTSGNLAAGDTTYISIHCVSGQMKAGTYTVTLTLRDTDSGTVVAAQTATIVLIVSG